MATSFVEPAKMSLNFLVDDCDMPDAKLQPPSPSSIKPRARPCCSSITALEPQPNPKRAKKSAQDSSVRADLHAQMMRYGAKLFIKDSEGKYACFFENCDQRMCNNFSRHVYGHEQRGDKVKSVVKTSQKELCFVDQTPNSQFYTVFGGSGPSSPAHSPPPGSPNSSILTPSGSPMASLTASPILIPVSANKHSFDVFCSREALLGAGGFNLAPPKYN